MAGNEAELYVEARHRLGEAIIWHAARQRLMWIDLLDPALFEHDPETGHMESRRLELPPPIGAIAATSDPGLLALTHRHGLSLLTIADLTLTHVCDPEAGRDAIIWNDAKCDRWGRLWIGSSHEKEREPRGALWCVKDGRSYALGDAGFAVSNGPAFSPDGRTLYFNDSAGRATLAYDIFPGDIHPRNRRTLITYGADEGLPDGVITDAEGCLWVAHWGAPRISRYRPDGRLIRTYRVPAGNVTTMCFGGSELQTLYIATARDSLSDSALAEFPLTGSIFRLDTETQGLPEPLFAVTA